MNLLSSKCSSSSNNFYANILLSQIESVEAVCHFEKKLNECDIKTETLENDVEYLKTKCSLLEETLVLLKSFVVNSALNVNLKMESIRLNNDSVIKTPFSTLTQICSNLYEHEHVAKSENAIVDDNVFRNNLGSTTPIKMIPSRIDNRVECSSCLNCSKDSTPSLVYNHNQMSQFKWMIKKDDDDFEGVRQRLKEIQRLFNKRVKYEVNKKFGINYLAEHQVRELDLKEMHNIKMPIKIAWSNAMNSLRQDRHQLKKRKFLRK